MTKRRDKIRVVEKLSLFYEEQGGDYMNDLRGYSTVEKKKVIAIVTLFIAAIMIVLVGAGFTIYSFIYNVNFPLFKSQVHGGVFGAVITFLGIRYFLSVQKLKIEVYKADSKFSWNNFKKNNK